MHLSQDNSIGGNLREIMTEIRDFLHGNAKDTTEVQDQVDFVIGIILCRQYDKKYLEPIGRRLFYYEKKENFHVLEERIGKLLGCVTSVYPGILNGTSALYSNSRLLPYMVEKLQNIDISFSESQALSHVYEFLVPNSIKSSLGQFFTPDNVLEAAVKLLKPRYGDKIIDPACGTGGFLLECLKYASQTGRSDSSDVSQYLYGIDKDNSICRIARAGLLLKDAVNARIFCEDSLDSPENWSAETVKNIGFESFDIVFANPPFGVKIPVIQKNILEQYEFGHEWIKHGNTWSRNGIKKSECPQVLFIERCLQLMKNNGKLAIILPDGILSNPTDAYIRQELLRKAELHAIIDLPLDTFLPHTAMKTHLLLLKKTKPAENYSIFMGFPKYCGHDKRGRKTTVDEIILSANRFDKHELDFAQSPLAFIVSRKAIKEDILLPKYYEPELPVELSALRLNGRYEAVSFNDLLKRKLIVISKGHEIGSRHYGSGDIPFIRTSEICNWEICADPVHCISEEIYKRYSDKQNIKQEDILFINDGTYLIGRAAMITDLDTRIVFQSHFRKLTVAKNSHISPYLLLGLLGYSLVQKQIAAKTFRQGTISTLGNRLLEVILPVPADSAEREYIHQMIYEIIKQKRDAKYKAQSFGFNGRGEKLMGCPGRGSIGNY
ncbi:MAG: N-6 DNA methylase [Bacillota bacterium]